VLFIGTYAGGFSCIIGGGLGGACCTTGALGALGAGCITEGMSSPIGITPVKPIPIAKATAVIPMAIPIPILSAPLLFGAADEPESLGELGLDPSHPFGIAPPSVIIMKNHDSYDKDVGIKTNFL
jgi:hypothetical protein